MNSCLTKLTFIVAALLLLTACTTTRPTPSLTPSPTGTIDVTDTPTILPTGTPLPTATIDVTATPSPYINNSPTPFVSLTPTPKPTPSPSPTPYDLVVPGAIYAQATGSNGDGSKAHPYTNLQQAIDSLSPGNTLYLRGGTYNMASALNVTKISGWPGSPIVVSGYPGEKAILDYTNVFIPNEWGFNAFWVRTNYWHLKNFTIQNVPSVYRKPPQTSTYQVTALLLDNTRGCVTENLTVCHVQGGGISIVWHATENLIKNCDVYDCHDLYSPAVFGTGGNANCITVLGTDYNTTNRLEGCRVWNASDDGFDLWGSVGEVIMVDCWAFYSGFDYKTRRALGNGQGFKLGKNTDNQVGPPRQLIRCVSAFNLVNGFDDNGSVSEFKFVNCLAYENGSAGFHLNSSNQGTFFNCASTDNGYLRRPTIEVGNSWQIPYILSSDDFVSVDYKLALAPRNPDGSLPVNNFLRPKKDSPIVNVGSKKPPEGIELAPYKGKAPDLGPFEVA